SDGRRHHGRGHRTDRRGQPEAGRHGHALPRTHLRRARGDRARGGVPRHRRGALHHRRAHQRRRRHAVFLTVRDSEAATGILPWSVRTPPRPHRSTRVPFSPIVITEEFEQALALLRSGSSLFLTGRAGTGKSTLIRHFLAETDRRVLVAAPTGIAALGVGGYTLHRVFGFRAGTTLDDVEGGAYRPGRFTKAIAQLQTLIIDEASMVRAD